MNPDHNSRWYTVGSTAKKQLSQSLAMHSVFFILLAVAFPYHYGFRFLSLSESIMISLLEAAIFSLVLWLTARLDLARVTLCFLALPYLIFFAGWLNAVAAVILLIVFIYSFANTLRATVSTSNNSITSHDVLAFILIIIWVNLSGAGGYGHQSADYAIHNARLNDLIEYSWPVHYGTDQNFVSYFGYFLPAAVIGKFSSTEIAFRSMYPWTVLGVTLAIRWLGFLSGWRFSIILVCVFIFFGPLDILNVLTLGYHADIPLHSAFTEALVNTDYVDFRTHYDIGFIVGNYLSNTFQLFWSPHQVIAGWLCISLMTYLFLQKQMGQFIFIYALLCLWSPLIMIALSPFVLLAAVVLSTGKKCSGIFTLENTLGAGVITAVFVVFYLGGSPQAIPSPFIFDRVDWADKGWMFALFYLSAWGLYSISLAAYVSRQNSQSKCWFIVLIFILLILPLKQFGIYSDLLCRGSAPLMFLLLIFILQAIHHYHRQKSRLFPLLLCLLLLGSASSLLQLRNAINDHGAKPEAGIITGYIYAEENLGPDNTLFNRYFRHKLH